MAYGGSVSPSAEPLAWEAEVRESHRLFLCARCGRQVRICSDCDRGNFYCSEECAAIRRGASLREAGQRYQRTPKGARNHALRQGAYRVRLREEVTHQGSDEAPVAAEPHLGEEMRLSEGEPTSAPEWEAPHDAFVDQLDEAQDNASSCSCDLCGRAVGVFARLDFLTTPCTGGWP